MKSRFINMIILKVAIVFSIGCKEQKQEAPAIQSGVQIMDSLNQAFVQLEDLSLSNPDFEESAITINQKIRQTIKELNTRTLILEAVEAYRSGSYNFEFVVSEDVNLSVFSWDSRLGGTMMDFQNKALLISNEGVAQDSLHQNMAIDHVFSLENNAGKKIYFMKGWGKESNVEYYRRLNAFEVVDNELKPVNLLPNQLSLLELKYSLNEIDETEVPDFKLENDGKRILIPEIWRNRFIYRPIGFDGDSYRIEIETFNNIFREEDFTANSESAIKLIKGSEMPTSVQKNGEGLHLVFEDGSQIAQIMDYMDELTRVVTKSKQGTKSKFAFDSYAQFIGKYNQYLFFDEGGVSEEWVLSIYDMSGQMPVLSLNAAHVFLDKSNLIFAKKTSEDDLEIIPHCKSDYGDQVAYFQIYAFDFTANNPILKMTENYFCGFAQ